MNKRRLAQWAVAVWAVGITAWQFAHARALRGAIATLWGNADATNELLDSVYMDRLGVFPLPELTYEQKATYRARIEEPEDGDD